MSKIQSSVDTCQLAVYAALGSLDADVLIEELLCHVDKALNSAQDCDDWAHVEYQSGQVSRARWSEKNAEFYRGVVSGLETAIKVAKLHATDPKSAFLAICEAVDSGKLCSVVNQGFVDPFQASAELRDACQGRA